MEESTSKRAVIFGLLWLAATVALSVLFEIS